MKNKITISERIQKLKMQKHAGVITESQYEKRLKLAEEVTSALGSTSAIGLSKIDMNLAGAMSTTGAKDTASDDDKITSNSSWSGAASSLKAAQTEIIKEKAASMAIAMLLKKGFAGPGGNLESIVSGDSPNPYIMDGHHRWAATILCDPAAQLQATQIMLPGGPLVTVLNIATKGLLGKAAGNTGTGAIAEFTAANLTTVLDSFLQKGTGGSWTDYPLPAEDVKKALTDFGGGDLEAGKKKMAANADTLPKDILPGAPPRVEMPYIGPKEVAIVAKALADGLVDVAPPYSKATLKVAPYLAKTTAPAAKPAAAPAAAPVAESYHKTITKMLHEAIKKQK